MTKAADRKNAHLDLARGVDAQTAHGNGFDRVVLSHNALPECDLDAIDLTCRFLGKRLTMPLMIGAMTGGTDRADAINLALAKAAQKAGIALAVGSQRASIENQRNQHQLRKIAPDIPIIANLGGVQLARPDGLKMAQDAVAMLEADAIAIHLNPLQEAAQPEGDRNWHGVEDAIGQLVQSQTCPVIIKEVGAGITKDVAMRLDALGVRYIDVAGLGGTNWTRIETLRHQNGDNPLMTPFLDWGISTFDALIDLQSDRPESRLNARLIASGGIRHGLDAAKGLWLGADMIAAAGHFLRAVEDGDGQISPDHLDQSIELWRQQMQLALFLTGSKDIQSFRAADGHIRD